MNSNQLMKNNTKIVHYCIIGHKPRFQLHLPTGYEEVPYAMSVDHFYYSGDYTNDELPQPQPGVVIDYDHFPYKTPNNPMEVDLVNIDLHEPITIEGDDYYVINDGEPDNFVIAAENVVGYQNHLDDPTDVVGVVNFRDGNYVYDNPSKFIASIDEYTHFLNFKFMTADYMYAHGDNVPLRPYGYIWFTGNYTMYLTIYLKKNAL